MAMPPALARYWRTHSRKSGAKKGGSGIRRSSRGSAPKAPKVSVWRRLKERLSPADPVEMALMGLVGYLLPNAVTATGIPMAAYTASKASSSPLVQKYGAAIDYLYSAVENTEHTGPNIWANGGASGFGKIAGTALAAKVAADVAKTGKISSRDLNGVGPLALGLILDPPADGGGSASGSVSSDGW